MLSRMELNDWLRAVTYTNKSSNFTFKKLLLNSVTEVLMGRVCGSVGRVIASYIRDPRFESRYQQNFIYQMYNCKSKEKEAGNGPSLKKPPVLIISLGAPQSLSGALHSKIQQIFHNCQESNPCEQGEQHKRYLCAMPSP